MMDVFSFSQINLDVLPLMAGGLELDALSNPNHSMSYGEAAADPS